MSSFAQEESFSIFDSGLLPLKSNFFLPVVRRVTICNLERIPNDACGISIEGIKIIIILRRSGDCITALIVIPPKISGFESGEKEMCHSCFEHSPECCTLDID